MMRIALAGCFGMNNTGDDAILASWLRIYRERYPDVELVLVGGDPYQLAKWTGLPALMVTDWPSILDRVSELDGVHFVGGGVFYDYWDLDANRLFEPPGYAPMALVHFFYMARMAGLPCIWTSVGVGPLEKVENRVLLGEIVKQSSHFSVRDTRSLELLKGITPHWQNVRVTSDAVTAGFKPEPVDRTRIEKKYRISFDEPVLCISVKHWHRMADVSVFVDAILQSIQRWLDRTRGWVLLLPFSADVGSDLADDRTMHREIFLRVRNRRRVRFIDRYVPPSWAWHILQASQGLIGMRLHSIIMAMRTNTPFIALSYDPKVSAILEDAQLEKTCLTLDACPELPGRVDRLLEHADSFREPVVRYLETAKRRWEEHDVGALDRLIHGKLDVEPPLIADAYLRKALFRRFSTEYDYMVEIERLRSIMDELIDVRRSRGFAWLKRYWAFKESLRRHFHDWRIKVFRSRPVREPVTVRSVPHIQAGEERKAAIVAHTFFDFHGEKPLYGGSERYIEELVRVLQSMNIRTTVYQMAYVDFEREYNGVRVVGLNIQDGTADSEHIRFNRAIHQRIPRPDLTIYSLLDIATPRSFRPSIGISHGVHWEVPDVRLGPAELRRLSDTIVKAAANVDRVVANDTAAINWLRTVRYSLSLKCVYNPNFVDLTMYRPAAERTGDRERVVVLFPRRLAEHKGFWLMLQIVPDILRTYPNVSFHFVGQAYTEHEERGMRQLVNRFPARVQWRVYPREAMPAVYQEADISVIPTLYYEGTSLSCLEAMACGNALVVTWVGGLTDLVIHNYNGLVVAPTPSAVSRAIQYLVTHPEERERFGARAREVAESFDIERWRQTWKQTIDDVLKSNLRVESRKA